jgi:signal transduction histidine kinase
MITRMQGRLAARPLLVDATIALGLAALSMVAVAGGASDAGRVDPLSIGLLLLETLPLVVRRRWPIPILVVTLAATVAHAGLVEAGVVNESLGSLVALFTVGERYERRASVPAALAVAAAYAGLIGWKAGSSLALSSFIQTLLAVGVAWALGDWARARRLYAQTLEDNARLLEADREDRSRRAVQAEREQIARELHDIVTHHMSVIVIQAGAGMTALDRRPDQATTAFEAIARTSRLALTDMRRMLGMLGESAASGDPSREPQPNLDRLGQLVEEVRAAGLPIELSVDGDRHPLEAGVELSAYRIIQEALTNTLKHARGARARVALRYERRALEVEVVDEGGSGARDVGESGAGGQGLIGMRERVALFGGDFEAGPTPGGFRVRARLPLDTEPGAGA